MNRDPRPATLEPSEGDPAGPHLYSIGLFSFLSAFTAGRSAASASTPEVAGHGRECHPWQKNPAADSHS